jgi:hypothetical protein
MMYRIAAGIMLLFGGVTLVCVGVTYAGYAIYWALLPATGPAGAAAIAAAVFLLLPVLGWAFLVLRGRRRKSAAMRDLPPNAPENIALTFLASLAKEKPIVGMALAGLFGVATAFLRKKR